MPPSPYLAERIDQSWCPSCKEWTVLDAGYPCAWCDTILVKRKGGWKRPDIHGRISESAARAIHAKYETGTSARTLGRELYRVLGYKSAHGCETAISPQGRALLAASCLRLTLLLRARSRTSR